jgi:hypothetical protein
VSQSVYGSLKFDNDTTADVQAVDTTPVAITGFDTDGPSNGVTPANSTDDITVGANSGGVYKVFFHTSFEGTNAQTYTARLRDDNVEVYGCGANRKLSNTDVGNMGFSCLATIAAGSVMEVFIESDSASDTFDAYFLQFSLVRIK